MLQTLMDFMLMDSYVIASHIDKLMTWCQTVYLYSIWILFWTQRKIFWCSFVFRTNTFIQVWNYLRMSQFWVNCLFKTTVSVVDVTAGQRSEEVWSPECSVLDRAGAEVSSWSTLDQDWDPELVFTAPAHSIRQKLLHVILLSKFGQN